MLSPVSASSARVFPLAAAVAIVGLSAGLRLWRLDLVEFKNDEAGWLRLAEDMVRLGRVPVTGLVISIGIRAPALFVYLLAPIVAVSRDPRLASGAIALANTAGVAGTVLLGWRILSPLAGLVAGLAYATNVWAVFFARKVWNEDLVAPLTVLLFIALDQAVIADQVPWAVAAFPIYAVSIQLHPSVGVLAPLFLALSAVLLRRGHWRQLVLGGGLAVLTAVPYLAWSYKTNWTDLLSLRSSLLRPAQLDGEGPAYVLGLTGGLGNGNVIGVPLERLLPGPIASIPALIDTSLLGLGVAVAMVLVVAPGRAMSRRTVRLAGLLLWLLLPALLTIRHGIPLYDHYFLFVPPAGALLIAVGFQWLADRPGRRLRPILGLGLAGLVASASIQTVLVLRQLDYVAAGYAPDYGPPLAQSEAVAREVERFGASSGSQQLSVELEGDSEPIAYLARPFFPTLDLVKVGPVGLGPQLTSALPVADQRLPGAVLGPLEALDLHYADGVVALFASDSSGAAPGQPVALAMSWVMDDSARAAGDSVVWEVSADDPAGHEVARDAGVAHDAVSISPGEVVLSWFRLETPPGAPPGPYQLHVRRVDRANGQTLPFVDGGGATGLEWTQPRFVLAAASG